MHTHMHTHCFSKAAYWDFLSNIFGNQLVCSIPSATTAVQSCHHLLPGKPVNSCIISESFHLHSCPSPATSVNWPLSCIWVLPAPLYSFPHTWAFTHSVPSRWQILLPSLAGNCNWSLRSRLRFHLPGPPDPSKVSLLCDPGLHWNSPLACLCFQQNVTSIKPGSWLALFTVVLLACSARLAHSWFSVNICELRRGSRGRRKFEHKPIGLVSM